MVNIADPRYEPSHLDLHCLQMYIFCSTGFKKLNVTCVGVEDVTCIRYPHGRLTQTESAICFIMFCSKRSKF